MSYRTARPLIPILCLLLLFTACSDSTDPPATADLDGLSLGNIDPDAGTIVLKAVDVPMPEGPPVRLELLGSDLELDPDGEHVSVTVALRNRGDRPLPAPTILWLNNFQPNVVYVANPDTSLPSMSIFPNDGFIYDDEFGDDQVLDPDETSAGKLWRFHTPAQEPFSFGIRVEPGPGPAPDVPVIAGVCFYDLNRNGARDRGEPPLIPSMIAVLAPGGDRTIVRANEDGFYAYEIFEAGLHQLTHMPAPETFMALEYTTPNPLQVIITTGPDGELRGFHEAHFGAVPRGFELPPAIQFTEDPLESLHFAPWTLIEATVVAERLLAPKVTFSGCGPGLEPWLRFSLWTNGAFMESNPVQVDMVLVHELDEPCDSVMEGGYMFDLQTLIDSYREAYGHGVLMMNLIDFEGERHQIPLEIPEEKPRD